MAYMEIIVTITKRSVILFNKYTGSSVWTRRRKCGSGGSCDRYLPLLTSWADWLYSRSMYICWKSIRGTNYNFQCGLQRLRVSFSYYTTSLKEFSTRACQEYARCCPLHSTPFLLESSSSLPQQSGWDHKLWSQSTEFKSLLCHSLPP